MPTFQVFKNGKKVGFNKRHRWFNYRKNSKNWDTLNYYRDCLTNGIVGFYRAILRSKDADRIANRVDTDQTAPSGAVRSGSALFAQTYLSQYFKLLRCCKLIITHLKQ